MEDKVHLESLLVRVFPLSIPSLTGLICTMYKITLYYSEELSDERLE